MGTNFMIVRDKGERCGLGRLVRELKYWCKESLSVISIHIDADGANSPDVSVAEATNVSLSAIEKHINGDTIIKLVAAIIDTCGGEIIESNAAELQKLNRCFDNFLVANSTFHALSKFQQNAWENNFGKGGLGMNTTLQFLHICYRMQDALGEDFKYQWKTVAEKEPPLKKMEKPVLTRWGFISRAYKHVLCRWNEWVHVISHGYEKYNTKVSTIICNALKQLHTSDGDDNLKLKCEVQFLAAFCGCYWDVHF